MDKISDVEREANEEFFADHPNEECPSWCSGNHDTLAHLAGPEQQIVFDDAVIMIAVGSDYGRENPPQVRLYRERDGKDYRGTAADARRLAAALIAAADRLDEISAPVT